MAVIKVSLLSAVLMVSLGLSPSLANPTADGIQQGQVFYENGQYAEAIQVLQQAIAQSEAQGDRDRQITALGNLSLTYQQLGDWPNAESAIARGLQLSDGGSAQRRAQILEIQARLQLSTGQTERALANWKQATQLYTQAGDRSGVLRSRLNQAQALRISGLYRHAFNTLTEVNQALQAEPDSATKVITLRSLGDAIQSVGDLEQAEAALKQSLALAQKLSLPNETGATLLSLGNLQRAANQAPIALKFYEQAAETGAIGMTQTQAQINRFSLLSEMRRREEATALIRPIQTQLDALPATRSSLNARIHFAQSWIKLAPTDTKPIAQILATTATQAQTLKDVRTESYAIGTLGSLYEYTQQWSESEKLTQQALRLAQLANATESVYRWQWQLGRVLQRRGDRAGAIAAYDGAVTTLQSVRHDLVGMNREVQFNFRDSVEPLYRESVALLLSESSPSETALDQARRRIEALQLAELDNFFREACLNSQSIALDQVVDRDNPTAAIVYPILLDDRLEVILKIPHQPLRRHTVKLSRSQIESTLERVQETLLEIDRTKEMRSNLQTVYQWLIQPVESELRDRGVKTLVFVLDGSLRNIPMAALYDGQQFLTEKYAIALSPGLQLLTPQPLAPTKLNALTAGLTQPPSPYERAFSPLPEVKSELDAIKQAGVTTTQLLDKGFTRATLERQINALPFQVVHFATHGQFSSQAKQTFILAADGPITIAQLDGLLRRRTQASAIELLVLSACRTATGDNRATLGLAGMAVRAGARSTVASLWHVDDSATAFLIGEFYRTLATGTPTKAEALRQAQLTLLKQSSNYTHPRYWAPFVLAGNWL